MDLKNINWTKVVGGIAIIGVIIIGGVVINRALVKRRIRKSYEESKEKEEKDVDIVNPKDIEANKGKTIYAKPKSMGGSGYVNVRSSAKVDNDDGWFDSHNFLGMVVENKPVGKILEGNIYGEGKVWYKITINTQNLEDNKELGFKADKSVSTGYVREDNVIIK